MSEFPFQRVLDFLGKAPPFDTLNSAELEGAARLLEIDFFPAGEVIIESGGPPSRFIYIIQSGSAKVSLPQHGGEEMLVDIRGEGDIFGALSLLQGSKALFQVTAREDTICYLMPAAPFQALVEEKPAFKNHFQFSLARNFQAVRRTDRSRLPQVTGLTDINLDTALLRGPVADFMSHEVLHCPPMTSVRAAAHQMSLRRVDSIIISNDGKHPAGIITDTDIRVRVVAAGQSVDQPVAEFMTSPVAAIPASAFGFEALLEMSRKNLHHLAVVENGEMVGVVSDHDLEAMSGGSPVGVVRDIDKVDNVDDLVRLHVRIDRVLEMLLRMGGSARNMLELVTEFNDRLTVKLIDLTLEEMEEAGLGRPPVPWQWMALGSEGRREQTLRTDQDNALIFRNVPPEHEDHIKQWFLGFAERVVAGLEACGFPRCLGGVMAVNPEWCLTEKQWARTFGQWIQNPNPKTLRLASIFFDYRPIYSEADLLEGLDASLSQAMEGNRLFLRNMARNALYNKPPLGFFRQFVVDKAGEHKNKLNLKLSGLTPVVDAARVMALDLAIEDSAKKARLHEEARHGFVTNTLDRLGEIANRGLLKPDFAEDLIEAFGFITILRITHHLEARARGEVPDNFVDPAKLGSLQRKMLKESFGVINRLQDILEHRYQTTLMS